VPKDPASVAVLTAAVERNDGSGGLAIRYLSDLGPQAAPAAAALARVVEKGRYERSSPGRTWYAIHALSRIGPQALPAVPALLARLGQDQANPHVFIPKTNYVPAHSNMIAYTLARIGPDVVPDLLKVLRDEKSEVRRRAAVLALGFLGPKAEK